MKTFEADGLTIEVIDSVKHLKYLRVEGKQVGALHWHQYGREWVAFDLGGHVVQWPAGHDGHYSKRRVAAGSMEYVPGVIARAFKLGLFRSQEEIDAADAKVKADAHDSDVTNGYTHLLRDKALAMLDALREVNASADFQAHCSHFLRQVVSGLVEELTPPKLSDGTPVSLDRKDVSL